jgi:2-phospho-L-lactate/phosphoenolpyruvate guanylyltransferase
MLAIVPIKRFALAKQRLAPIASDVHRARFSRAMAERLLTEISRSEVLAGVLVVSGEESLSGFVRSLGFDFKLERGLGLNGALSEAVAALSREQAAETAVIHADLPFFSAREFDDIADLHLQGEDRQISLVPDTRHSGTNVRFDRPAGVVPFRYGAESFDLHLRAALAKGFSVEVLESPSLSLDCDTPDDVRAFWGLDQLVVPVAGDAIDGFRRTAANSNGLIHECNR